jgi:hypothetical protein
MSKSWADQSGGKRDLLETLESRRMLSTFADVALIDTSLPNFNQLSQAVSERSRVILYDGKNEPASKVLGKLVAWAAATKQQIHSVSILSHGAAGKFSLGKDWISNEKLQAKAWAKLKTVLADDANIYLFGCNVASQSDGQNLLDHLATISGADVYGSNDLTGKAGDWILEAASKGAPARDATPLNAKSLMSWDFSLAIGITVTPTSGLTTTEAGGTAQFTVVLDQAPGVTDIVTVPISSSNTAEGTVSTASLNFDFLNWSTPQTVTVTGINDAIDDDNVAYSVITGAATSTDPAYNGFDASDVSLSNTDNDTAGVTVTPTTGLQTTEAAGTATFNVSLNSEPTAPVTIDIASSNTTEGTVSLAQLTFDNTNWNIAQTITVTGQNEFYDDGDIPYTITTAPAVSADPKYSGFDAANVAVTNLDNDTVGVTVAPTTGLTTTEAGGTAQFTVVLTSRPTADVTIGISSSAVGEGTVSVSSLTFTDVNWNVPQTVTVTGVNEFIDDGNASYTIVTAPATSGDAAYNNFDAGDVSITNTDDDTAGFTITPGTVLTTTEAGGTANFTVKLNSQPTATVTIDISSNDLTEGTVSTSQLIFDNTNWNVAQTVTATGADDFYDDGNVGYTIVTAAAVSTDGVYNTLNPNDVSASNTDNDTAGVSVTPTSGLTTTEIGGTATFNVVLLAQPTSDVTIAVSSSDLTEGTVATSLLTFTTLNWNSAQTITVTGVNDDVDDANIAYTIVTGATSSSDAAFNALAVADVSVSNTDDDTAGISVSPVSGLTTTEAGGTAQFNVALTSQPTSDVTIAIASSNTAEGTVSTSLLTFTAANWNVAQPVTVTGVNDVDDDDDIAYTITTAPASSGDANYNTLDASDVAITNLDDDTAGFTVSPTSGLSTTEAGGATSFNVRLNSRPTADVTIGISSSNTAEGTVSTSLLTFTAANWNVNQTVTVTGVDDLVDDNDIAYTINTAAAVSADAKYNTLNAADVSVTNVDNDTAGITVTPTTGLVTTEAGGTAQFNVVLTSKPTNDVVINLSSSNPAEGTPSVASLTFTAGNWNVNQTVTVTGVDDFVDDANVSYSIVTAAAVSADATYNNMNAADVSLSNTDNDTAGITVSPTSGLTTVEAGSEVSFTVVLDSQPTANVSLSITSNDLTEGTVSTSLLTFTAADWNVPQTVTVSSVDDAIVDGNITYSVVTGAASSTDPLYNTLNPSNVSIINRDNDPNGIRIGGEFRVNTFTANSQTFSENNQSIAMNANGDFVVSWASSGQDGSGFGVYAQRYNSAGVAQGSEFRVNSFTTGDQMYRSVAMDAAGNFIVVWTSDGQDGSSGGIYGQRYNAAGVAQGAEFRINTFTAGDQSRPRVSYDAAGNFVVAWGSNGQDGSGWGVYAQRYSAAGVAQGAEFRVNTTTSNNQQDVALGMSANGTFVVSWSDSNGGWEIFAQRYSAAGVAQGGQFQVNTESFKEQRYSAIAMDDAGNFVITWSSQHQDGVGNRFGVFGQRYNAVGAALGGEFQVNTFTGGDQRFPSIAMDADGDYVIAWAGTGRDGSGWGVFGQQYQSDGTARGGEFRINSYTTGDQIYPSVGMDANGDYTVVWSSYGQDGSAEGIYAQQYEGGNDAPINSVPGAQTVNEDAVLTFSSANGNLISISDVDAYSNAIRVSLTATNGLLTLNGTTGLTFTTGDGTTDAVMVFTGTVSSINTALFGMTFGATANYNGAAAVQITTNDLGNTGWDGAQSDTDTVNVTVDPVNDAPTNTVPGAQVTNEDTSLVFSTANGNRISVSDIDVATGNMRITLAATNGTLTLATLLGLSFVTGDGVSDATMTFTGTLAAVNAAMDGLAFTPGSNFYGAASVQITSNDQGNTGSGGSLSAANSIAVTVSPINDAPVNTVPGAQITNEDIPLVFSTANGNLVAITDVDAAASPVRLTLTVTNGLLSLNGTTGLTFTSGDGTSDSTMTFTGTLTDINAALDGMSFAPTLNYNGAATLQVTTNDQGNSGAGGALSDADTVNITVNAVNDPPVNTVPGAQSLNEDGTLVFSTGNSNRISISDLDAGGSAVRVTLTGTNGLLSLNGITGLSFTLGDGTSDATMTFTGTIAAINTALDGLSFSPNANFNGAASVQISTSDQGNTGAGGAASDTDTVVVTVNPVNDAPVLNGANTIPAIDEDDVTNTGMLISDLIAGQVSEVDAGALEGIAVTAVDNTNGTWQYTTNGSTWNNFGNPSAALARLLASDATTRIRFVPNLNYNGTAGITFRAWDRTSGAAGATGNSIVNGGTTAYSTATATSTLTINAVNDAPVNSLPGGQSINEDGFRIFSTANGNRISISDVDAGGATVRVTLSVNNGLLTLNGTTGLGFTAGDGTADATMTFSGTIASINAALDGLRFDPSGNFNGVATLQILTNDLGNLGSGGALTDTDNVAITVNAVNDAPVNTVPGAQVADEDTPLVFSAANGNAISVFDLDAAESNGIVSVTMNAPAGRLTLSSLSGLTFSNGDGVSDPTMTFSGTVADVNAALEGLVLLPTANYNGATSFQITTNDLGNTGIGGALSDSDSVTITVNQINDAPTISAPATDSTNEDTARFFTAGNGNAISVGDVDSAAALLELTIGVTNGALTLSGTTGLTFITGDGAADGTMTFTGTLTDINAALAGLRYDPTLNYNGGAVLSIVVSDLGNTGAGGTLGDSTSVALTVNAVNDAPVNTVPGAQQVDEDDALVFSSGNGNAISIADLDLLAGTAQVTLTATNGLLTLSGITGLVFSTGDGSDNATMTFTGSIAAINAALEGMSFAPTADYVGGASVQITTSDQGNTGIGGALSDTDTVAVTVNGVNDAPIINMPVSQNMNEDAVLTFSSGNGNLISLIDIDAAGGPLSVTLSVPNGTLTLASLTGLTFITGDGAADGTMTFTGTLANINAALNGLSYAPGDYNGSATIQIDVDDQGNTGAGGSLTDSASVDVIIAAVNDSPVNIVPGPQSTNEDTALVFSTAGGNAIVVTDIDVDSGDLSITLTATNGTLTLAGLTGLLFSAGDGTGDATMTFTGTLAAINAALNGLTYSPNLNYNGPAALTIATNDQGNTGMGGFLSDTDTINLTVDPINDAPTMTAPGPQVTDEDIDLVFSSGNGNSIVIADLDAGSADVQVTLTATYGTLTLGGFTGLVFSAGDGTGDATMTFTGTLAEVNAALEGLTFKPGLNYNGAASIQITADDQGNTGAGGTLSVTKTVAVNIAAVNDAPVVNMPASQVTDEDTVLVLSIVNGNEISISDVDVAGGTMSVTLSSTNGTLSLSQLTGLLFSIGDGTGDATMTFTGTLTDINAALDGMTFSPALNYNGPATIAVNVNDQGNTGQVGALSDSKTLDVTVDAVNDAPVNVVPVNQTVVEDTVLFFSTATGNAIRVTDLDAASGLLEVTLTATNGSLTLANLNGLVFSTGDGTGDVTMTFTGTLTDINAALEGMAFAPFANVNGAASVQISTNDQGNTGIGGAQSDTDTVNIFVTAVNDAPVVTAPTPQVTNEDTALVFSTTNGNAISVYDVDAAILRVTLSVTNGTLALAGTTGLTFIAGDGNGDATMTFTGSQADINAALDGLSFSPGLNYNGSSTLQISTSDQGQTGTGGVKTDSASVGITVNAINDAPVNTVPGAQVVDEDGTLVFSFANGNRILVSDIDAGGASIRITLTATNGVLSLAGITGLSFSGGVGDGVDDATMTFTGSINDINDALEGLIFKPLANFAGPATIQIVTNDRGRNGAGGPLSSTSTIGVTVNPINDAPVVNTAAGKVQYTENDAATIVDAEVTISDVDDNRLEGASIDIVGYVEGEDILSFTDQNGITGTWDASTGVLSLSGDASVADYQAALRSITYTNTSDNPNTETRTVRFVVGDGRLRNDAAGKDIAITAVNDAPTADPLVITLQEDAGRSTVDLWSVFNDIENADSDLTLRIVSSSNPAMFSSTSIDAATGKLILNSAQDAAGEATLTVSATDRDGRTVQTTVTVTVNAINDAPVVLTTSTQLEYDDSNPTVAIDPDLVLGDVDSGTLSGAVVRIVASQPGRDLLEFENQNGITGVFDDLTGTLTLSGEATVAQYQAALRSITYTSLGSGGGSRAIQFAVRDEDLSSAASTRTIKFPVVGPTLPPPSDKPETPPTRDPVIVDPLPPTKPKPIVERPAQMDVPPTDAWGAEPTPTAQQPPTPPLPVPVVPAPLAEAIAPRTEPIADAFPEPITLPPPPVPPAPVAVAPAPPEVKPTAMQTQKLWQQLDELAKDLDSQVARPKISVGSVAGMTTTLMSVGYVIWCLRGGSLVATLLTTLPLWRWLDPLPVLDREEEKRKGDKQNDEDEERIRTMMD